MSRVEVVSVELDRDTVSLGPWADALSTYVGRVPRSMRDQEAVSCISAGLGRFSGRIEAGTLGNMLLAKLTATPYRFSRSLRVIEPTIPIPVMLVFQVGGRSRFDQNERSCTIWPGDWCLVDTLYPFEHWALDSVTECYVFALERPSESATQDLFRKGIARRWSSKTGMARVLQATAMEAFNQINGLALLSERSLHASIAAMATDAVQEQIESPPGRSYRDMQIACLKAKIEPHLFEPDLSVDSIARACGMSVRSLHRAFEADAAGSVSKYVWMRRLSRCAAVLRDPTQAHRPITEICFSFGFNSSSHFSRLFKHQFGVPPRDYRPFNEITRRSACFGGIAVTARQDSAH